MQDNFTGGRDMKRFVYIITAIVVTAIAVLIWVYQYLYIPVELRIESSGFIHTSEVQPKIVRVDTILVADHEVLKQNYFTSLNVNFQKNYLIISSGREIIGVNYKRISKFTAPFNGPYEAIVTLKDEFHSNRIYYYITEHIPCLIDVGGPEMYIEGRKVGVSNLILPES